MVDRKIKEGTVFSVSYDHRFHGRIRRELRGYTITPYLINESFIDGIWSIPEAELDGVCWVIDEITVGDEPLNQLHQMEVRRAEVAQKELGAVAMYDCIVIGYPKHFVEQLEDHWESSGPTFDQSPA